MSGTNDIGILSWHLSVTNEPLHHKCPRAIAFPSRHFYCPLLDDFYSPIFYVLWLELAQLLHFNLDFILPINRCTCSELKGLWGPRPGHCGWFRIPISMSGAISIQLRTQSFIVDSFCSKRASRALRVWKSLDTFSHLTSWVSRIGTWSVKGDVERSFYPKNFSLLIASRISSGWLRCAPLEFHCLFSGVVRFENVAMHEKTWIFPASPSHENGMDSWNFCCMIQCPSLDVDLRQKSPPFCLLSSASCGLSVEAWIIDIHLMQSEKIRNRGPFWTNWTNMHPYILESLSHEQKFVQLYNRETNISCKKRHNRWKSNNEECACCVRVFQVHSNCLILRNKIFATTNCLCGSCLPTPHFWITKWPNEWPKLGPLSSWSATYRCRSRPKNSVFSSPPNPLFASDKFNSEKVPSEPCRAHALLVLLCHLSTRRFSRNWGPASSMHEWLLVLQPEPVFSIKLIWSIESF